MKYKNLLNLLILCLFCFGLQAQTTYTWNVSSGNWAASGSWSPARVTPLSNDILVFNGSVIATASVTNVPAQTIGKLMLTNNAVVNIISGDSSSGTGQISSLGGTTLIGTGTSFNTQVAADDILFGITDLTMLEVQTIVSDTEISTGNSLFTFSNQDFRILPKLIVSGGANAFSVAAGCSLNVTISNPSQNGSPLILYMASGSTADINGVISFGTGGSRLNGADAASIVFKSGSVCQTTTGFSGSVFMVTGNNNVVSFENGSSYIHSAGANPFGLATPNSKVAFATGSTYRQQSVSFQLSGRTVANFEIAIGASNATLLFSNPFTCDNFTLTSAGNVNFNASSPGAIHVKGNLTVNGGTFNVGTANSGNQTLLFNGITSQNIGGSGGTINFGTKSVLGIDNNSQLNLGRSLVLNNQLTITSGSVNLNGNTMSFGSNNKVRYDGNAPQTTTATELPASGGPVTLEIANPAGVTLHASRTFTTLNMIQGNLLLNGNTLTLGLDTTAANKGTLAYTSGFITGAGTFSRWFNHTNIPANDTMAIGLFPFGSGTSDRSLQISGAPSVGGMMSVQYNDVNGASAITPSFTENAGALTVNNRSNCNWTVSTSNNFASTGLTMSLRAYDLPGITTVSDLVPVLANTAAPGTFDAGSGTLAQAVVSRSGLVTSAFNNTFYIGSDVAQNPLPVDFLSFEGTAAGQLNKLVWTTASSIGINYYEVERSADGKRFVKVGEVKALNGVTARQYTFTDKPVGSVLYYRIKAAGNNGEATYSNVVVLNRSLAAQLKAYPNPANDMVKIEGLGEEQGSARIYNALGKEFTIDMKADHTINIGELQPGVYYLQVSGSDVHSTIRLIKN